MQPRLIYDVGMHNGDDTAYYLSRGFDVVGVEADPSLAASAQRRFAGEIADGRLTLLNVGIAPEAGKATFWLCQGRSEWNSFDRVNATRGGRECQPVEVACRPFRDILRQFGVPYYLKIDIETYDRHCLRDLDPANLPEFVSIEINDVEELLILKSLGFDAFKLVSQRHHEAVPDDTRTLKAWALACLENHPRALHIVQKAATLLRKLRRAVSRLAGRVGGWSGPNESPRTFPFGSSGDFGDDAPGAWLDFGEAAYRWLALQRTKSVPMWCDVHARRVASLPIAKLPQPTRAAA